MKEKEKSSIEWLFEQLPDHLRLSRNGFEILQYAKQLHKKEIIEAYFSAKSESGLSASDCEIYYDNSEQYYTEKYSTE